jgi:hypothetical protein
MTGLGINAEQVLSGEQGDRPSVLPLYVGILKWLTLLRLYRVVQLFARYKASLLCIECRCAKEQIFVMNTTA